MYISIADRLRKLAFMVGDDYSGDAPYLNIPIYQDRIEPEEDSTEIDLGPPSLYDDPSEVRKRRRKKDIRRQGPRPDPVDSLFTYILPVTTTNIGDPREDEQGKVKDTVTPDGRNENNDTIGFDPGELNVNPFRTANTEENEMKLVEYIAGSSEGMSVPICKSCRNGNHLSYGIYHLPSNFKIKLNEFKYMSEDEIENYLREISRYSCKNLGMMNGKSVQCMCHASSIADGSLPLPVKK